MRNLRTWLTCTFRGSSPGERSFDFEEAEVREQLSHLSRQKQDTIVGIFGTYEPTVFETREMPHLAPHRHWDLDITEMEGARPQAGRPYPCGTSTFARVKQTD